MKYCNRNWQYNQTLPMTWAWYAIQLWFVKGNRDCQNAYGNGICGGSMLECNNSWIATTPWVNGTNANQQTPVTALGIHNPWGNAMTFMGEAQSKSSEVRFSILCGKDHVNIASISGGEPPSTWKRLTIPVKSTSRIIEISSTCQEYPILGTAVSSTTAYTEYYADGLYGGSGSNKCVEIGGYFNTGYPAGPLYMRSANAVSFSSENVNARLHVVII